MQGPRPDGRRTGVTPSPAPGARRGPQGAAGRRGTGYSHTVAPRSYVYSVSIDNDRVRIKYLDLINTQHTPNTDKSLDSKHAAALLPILVDTYFFAAEPAPSSSSSSSSSSSTHSSPDASR
jgi:hypothetical protein